MIRRLRQCTGLSPSIFQFRNCKEHKLKAELQVQFPLEEIRTVAFALETFSNWS